MPRILPLLLLCAAANAAEVDVPTAPPSVFADTESVTNAALPARAMASARLVRCTVELAASASNCVEVAFGRDADGDGLSDASEILLGSNPLDADEDDDGVPDGFDSTGWTTNPLWAVNSTNDANVTILLAAPIPTNAAATLLVGDLAIPLREPASWSLCLELERRYTP